jgi:hypothetical protein
VFVAQVGFQVVTALLLVTQLLLTRRFLARRLHNYSHTFITGISILTFIGCLQTLFASLLLATSVSLTSLIHYYSFISFIVLISINLHKKHRIETTKTIIRFAYSAKLRALQNRTVYFLIGILSIFTFQLFKIKRLGDSGWDSNAYHLTLVGNILKTGSNYWPAFIGEGTYTFFAPYGFHVTGGLFAFLAGNLDFAVFGTWILVIGLTLVVVDFFETMFFKILGIFTIFLCPTFFGQFSHFYVDAAVAAYLTSAVLILAKLLKGDQAKGERAILLVIVGLLAGNAFSSKTQVIFLAIVVYAVAVGLYGKDGGKRTIMFSLTIFLLSSSIPYLRNLIFYANPVFPITNPIFKNGTISSGEIADSITYFIPQFWPSESIFLPLISILISPVIVYVTLITALLGRFPGESRLDLNGFTYDTTSGGAGIIVTGLVVFALIIFVTKIRIRKFQINSENFLLIIIGFVGFMLIPGSWWPRYGLVSFLCLGLASAKYIEKHATKNYLIPATAILVIPALAGLLIAEKYDFNSMKNGFRVNSKYGLDAPPQNFTKKCDVVYLVHPRPVFTSFIWEAECNKIFHVEESAIQSILQKSEAWIVLSEKIYLKIPEPQPAYCTVNAWFDQKGEYASYLIPPRSKQPLNCV